MSPEERARVLGEKAGELAVDALLTKGAGALGKEALNATLETAGTLAQKAGKLLPKPGAVLTTPEGIRIPVSEAEADWVRKIEGGVEGTGNVSGVKSAKEVEIVNQRGESLGEFDEIDLNKGVFYEDKSAQGLNKVNPKTGLPAQTPQEFADKQILTKTRNRISALENATSTRTTSNGSQEIPALEEIKGIKEFVFRLDGDTPELRQAVNNSINKLKEEFPDYKFSATFGGE